MHRQKKPFEPSGGSSDRRAGRDRRQAEAGPPGGRERRRNVEPRQPEVAEIDLTPSEWDALAELPLPPLRPRT